MIILYVFMNSYHIEWQLPGLGTSIPATVISVIYPKHLTQNTQRLKRKHRKSCKAFESFTPCHWKLVGGLEHFLFSPIVGMIFIIWRTPSFFRGIGISPVRKSFLQLDCPTWSGHAGRGLGLELGPDGHHALCSGQPCHAKVALGGNWEDTHGEIRMM